MKEMFYQLWVFVLYISFQQNNFILSPLHYFSIFYFKDSGRIHINYNLPSISFTKDIFLLRP